MTNPASLVESTPRPPLTSRTSLAAVVRTGVQLSVLALVTYYLLFRLPFQFPPRLRLMSPSYAFGFNNSVAILAMAGLLAGLTLHSLLRKRGAGELPIEFSSQRAVDTTPSMRWAFAIVAVGYAALTFVMYVYNMRSA